MQLENGSTSSATDNDVTEINVRSKTKEYELIPRTATCLKRILPADESHSSAEDANDVTASDEREVRRSNEGKPSTATNGNSQNVGNTPPSSEENITKDDLN